MIRGDMFAESRVRFLCRILSEDNGAACFSSVAMYIAKIFFKMACALKEEIAFLRV